jgi:hypothetical protein
VFNGNTEAYETYRNVTKVVAEVGPAICSVYYAAKGGNGCFVAGTLVATVVGHIGIENIKEGDWVWATNPETGETALKEVVRLFRNETEEWIHVTVNGEEIICTPEHPFYSPVKGWTNAVDLRAGDILVMLNGEYVVIEQVQHELLESPEATYNFEVEDYHTYYVGSTEVLVHNRCSDLGPYSQLKASGADKGNEVHHIIEKRFAKTFGVRKSQMPSVVLDHATHAKYTQLWREYLPYGRKYKASEIMNAAEKIYADSPELLAWARFTIIGG